MVSIDNINTFSENNTGNTDNTETAYINKLELIDFDINKPYYTNEIYSKWQGWTPLISACRYCHLHLVRWFFEFSMFREIRNPKPVKNNSIMSHGLLLCKKDCGLWNRDENSARNIYKIANNAINKKERPIYLSRSKVISGATSADGLQHHLLDFSNKATQSKFTRLETVKLC